jgi:hypothetical protein
MTTRMSRRSILARAAAGTAIAALPVRASAEGPDAELLALCPQFEAVYAELVRLERRSFQDRLEFEALVEAATGIKLADAPPLAGESEYSQIRNKIAKDDSRGADADAEIDWNSFHAHLYPLVDEILAYNATSREGVALQLRAFLCTDYDLWEDPGDERIAYLIESVCAFVGVDFPPAELVPFFFDTKLAEDPKPDAPLTR